jgi:hypothetical protein
MWAFKESSHFFKELLLVVLFFKELLIFSKHLVFKSNFISVCFQSALFNHFNLVSFLYH